MEKTDGNTIGAPERWVTARTIAEELGISLRRARLVVSQVGYKEVRGRLPVHFRPAKACRRSEVFAWAAGHQAELKAWALTSRRAKLAHNRARQRQTRELRLLASVLGRMPDPAPEVCFWLSLLCRYPGFSQLKEAALRALTAAVTPFVLAFIESEDRAIAPCRTCVDRALALGMNPLDYVAERGPCGGCEVGEQYYLLCFHFAGIGEFSFFVRYEAGRRWLPDPGGLPRVTLEAGILGRLERSKRAERTPLAPEEICGGLAAALARLAAGM